MLIVATLAITLAATAVSDEVSVNSARTTAGNPRSGNISNAVDVTFDAGERWSLLASAIVTAEGPTPAPRGAIFADRGGLVSAFSAGVEVRPGESWTLGLLAEFSPKNTQRSATQLSITTAAGATTGADALLQSTNSNGALLLSAEYAWLGESAVEASLMIGVALAHYDTEQRIVALEDASGNVAPSDAILRYCQTHLCSRALLHAIAATPAARLDSSKFSLGGALTFFRDTDLTVSGDYHAYRQDPTEVGYFSLASAGGVEVAGGAGVPIAPLRWMVRPELAHRFGDFSVKLWAQGGRYVDGAGQTTRGGGIKLQYKFSKSFRMWAKASGQRDVDSEGNVSIASTLALGAGYRF